MQTIILPTFKKSFKPLVKKFPSLKETVIDFLENFDKSKCIKIQDDLYKTRLKTKNLPKGKNKSFRIIVFIAQKNTFLIPIKIYFKSEQENMSNKELNKDLGIILLELKEILKLI